MIPIHNSQFKIHNSKFKIHYGNNSYRYATASRGKTQQPECNNLQAL